MELTALKVELFAKDMELADQKKVYQVPQTGQQVCWDNVSEDPTVPHSPVSCEGTGQDGGRRAGLAPPSPELRFTDNGDGTVTGNFTNLIWLKAGDCFGKTSWEEALENVANLRDAGRKFTRCGLADQSVAGEWRLPNVNEIMSLMDYGNTSPCLPDGHPFDGAMGGSGRRRRMRCRVSSVLKIVSFPRKAFCAMDKTLHGSAMRMWPTYLRAHSHTSPKMVGDVAR
jgi:hypothetical protein